MSAKEMRARLAAINTEAKAAQEANDGAKLDALLAEAEEISAKLENAAKMAKLHGIADAHKDDDSGKDDGEEAETAQAKRGKLLKAGAKVKMQPKEVFNAIPSATTAMPNHTATDVRDTFNDVSSLVDAVKLVPLPGGESYKRGFVKSYAEGDYTAEGGDAAAAEPEFDYVDINKAKITAYCEEPEEIKFQSTPSVQQGAFAAFVKFHHVADACQTKLS